MKSFKQFLAGHSVDSVLTKHGYKCVNDDHRTPHDDGSEIVGKWAHPTKKPLYTHKSPTGGGLLGSSASKKYHAVTDGQEGEHFNFLPTNPAHLDKHLSK